MKRLLAMGLILGLCLSGVPIGRASSQNCPSYGEHTDYDTAPVYLQSKYAAGDCGTVIDGDLPNGSFIYAERGRLGTFYHFHDKAAFVNELGLMGSIGKQINNSLGVSVTAGGDIKLVKVEGTVSYERQWGSTVQFNGITNKQEMEKLWDKYKRTHYDHDYHESLDVYVRVFRNQREVWFGDHRQAAEPLANIDYPSKDIVLQLDRKLAFARGNFISLDAEPFLDSRAGRVYVPLRFVAEAFNLVVLYRPADYFGPDRVQLSDPYTFDPLAEIYLKPGTVYEYDRYGEHLQPAYEANPSFMMIKGRRQELDAPAKLVNDRTMMPIRAVMYAVGAGQAQCALDPAAGCQFDGRTGKLVLSKDLLKY